MPSQWVRLLDCTYLDTTEQTILSGLFSIEFCFQPKLNNEMSCTTSTPITLNQQRTGITVM